MAVEAGSWRNDEGARAGGVRFGGGGASLHLREVSRPELKEAVSGPHARRIGERSRLAHDPRWAAPRDHREADPASIIRFEAWTWPVRSRLSGRGHALQGRRRTLRRCARVLRGVRARPGGSAPAETAGLLFEQAAAITLRGTPRSRGFGMTRRSSPDNASWSTVREAASGRSRSRSRRRSARTRPR